MSTRFLDPDEARKLMEGHEDVLTPMVKKEQAFFRHVPCPVCGKTGHSEAINTKNPFSPGSPLPNKILVCSCGAEFAPNSGIITKIPTGEPG